MSKRKTLFCIVFLILLFLIPMYLLRRQRTVMCGLKNHHNVCYINAVLQSLFSCESFTTMLESIEPENGSVMYYIQNLWNDMKNNTLLNRLGLYRRLASMSNFLFKYDNKPGFTENFLEFITINLDEEKVKGIFLDEENFRKTKTSCFFSKNQHGMLSWYQKSMQTQTPIWIRFEILWKKTILHFPRYL
ncbi:putative Peptidase C19, ubiquitin carboxyl-terminal hydrolase 2 protein [Trachipleistophora hominis]|uniref:Putative Peptidase C19, ubiquitin carboxyl-terminal hydrolase 2 protein n=1 Tax=Trachipleistophora hominis TaxID=72359 RepID=L7JTY9_TRAHO|nr:putative Peptidase C19, ubiquitin carboxyl-terminal hydrolase 2 protein [Trachipleistophora hominis]